MNEKLRLRAVDDTEIPALHIKRNGKYLLIASHGITSEKTEEGLYERFVELLPASYDAILFDFRGHGESNLDSMEVTITGELLDLMAVFHWARKQNYSAIDHVATSFGASIASATSRTDPWRSQAPIVRSARVPQSAHDRGYAASREEAMQDFKTRWVVSPSGRQLRAT